MNKGIIFFSLASIILLTGCVQTQARNSGVSTPEAVQYANDWPLAHHDYANTRATTTSSINSNTVGTLHEAWSFNISKTGTSGAFGDMPTVPLILGDTAYFHDSFANVYAVDINTGALKWSKIYNSTGLEGPFGVAIGYGKLFMQKDNYAIIALDLSTGEELWSTTINTINTTVIDIQPQVYDGLVYTSTVPGTGDKFYAGGGMGILYALNESTGDIVWSFNTVKDGNLWGNPGVNSGGGAWYTPSVDTNTGIMFWGIGNPAPFPGTKDYPNGSSYGYNTLYTDCSLAIDHLTGELVWYKQLVQHDMFDHDIQISEILVNNVTASGETHDVVIVAGKIGKVYSIDRATGELLWAVPVGVHTPNDQWDGLGSEAVPVMPSVLGGVETPMAYSDGIIYVPIVDLNMSWNSTNIDLKSLNFAAGKGELVALDVRSGNTVWVKNYDTLNVGGATVVNDVVFTATFNGIIYAFDKKTGEELFEYNATGGINGEPAVAGDTIIFPISLGSHPGLLALKAS